MSDSRLAKIEPATLELYSLDPLDVLSNFSHGPVVTIDSPLRAMGKPRQSQRDKWMERDVVMRYRSLSDQLRAAAGRTTKWAECDRLDWVVVMSTKDGRRWGKPHTLKPDKDNIEKLILDALFDRDQACFGGVSMKMWGEFDRIVLKVYNPR